MAREKNTISKSIKNVLKINGTLLTVVGIIFILGMGITIVDNPNNWWVSLTLLLSISAIMILIKNAFLILKIGFSIFIFLIELNYSFLFGKEYDFTGNIATLWMMSLLFSFFASLTISYFLYSSNSKWPILILSSILGFLTTIILLTTGTNSVVSVIAGNILFILVFTLWYRFAGQSYFRIKNFPPTSVSDKFQAKFIANIDNSFVSSNKTMESIVFWTNNEAYQIMNTDMEEAFEISGMKNDKLTYKGKNINSWLLYLLYITRKNVDTMLILVDINNTIGNKAKVIGVEVPDKKGKIPVGILPGQMILNNPKKMKNRIIKEFSDYAAPITEKDIKKLSKNCR